MKSLQVNKIDTGEKITLKNAALLLNNLAEVNKVDCVNWKEFPYKPRVEFRIGHTGDLIMLKFSVTEQSVRAVETEINGEVYKDSCVEFFLSIDGQHYYNFEFNAIGTPHVGWGSGRNGRKHLPADAVKSIQVRSSLGSQPFDTREGSVSWDLVVLIPASLLVFDPGINFDELSGSANFFKCGDALPEPHFVTWNPVGTPQPDYHQPAYFGRIDFE